MTRMLNVLALQELDEEIVVDAPISTISIGGC
ncbi:class III lanthipeptide [Streptomyces sp. CAS3]